MTARSAHWFAAAMCLCATVLNGVYFIKGLPISSGLLVLDLLAFAMVGAYQWHWSSRVHMRPQELAERMLKIQESERHHLSRELHDDIGQMLTGAQLQCAWLQRRVPPDLNPNAEHLHGILAETLEKVRDLSSMLNPRQLSSLGLEEGMRAHLVTALADSEVHWSLECQQRLTGIPEEMAVAAYRIAQEAVTNMLRHAQAKNLLVRLQRLPAGLSLLITDDGSGFDPAAQPTREGQSGLAGMRERVLLLGGSWAMHSGHGTGTRIEVVFPWPPRAGERARSHKKPQ